jgi:hypothetical protein
MAKTAKSITTGGYVSIYKSYIKPEDKDLNQGGFKSQTYRNTVASQHHTIFGTDRSDAIGVS